MGVEKRESTAQGRHCFHGVVCLAVSASMASLSLQAAPNDAFPVLRPTTRAQSVVALSGSGAASGTCLTPVLLSLRQDPGSASMAARRGLVVLQSEIFLASERRWVEADGTVLRYTIDRTSLDRIDSIDENGDGRPDVVEAALLGLTDAKHALVEDLELPSPGPLLVVLARIGANVEGYLLPSRAKDGRTVIVLDPSARGSLAGLRIAAIHQFAHAVAMASGPAVPPSWGEALSTWTVLRLTSGPDHRAEAAVSRRIEQLSSGLLTDDLELSAGGAAWFAFLEHAYGPTTLRLAVQELASGATPSAAFDRALRRGAGQTLAMAFRDFHLWTVLVGERADSRHLPFAARLASPRFASIAEGLPALSILSDPPVASLGATQVLLRPQEDQGGMTVQFEGEFAGRWDVDVLIVEREGSLHRVPVSVSSEGRGEISLPLFDLAEAILLVRNLEIEDRVPRRFTWWAQRIPGYPFDLTALEAVRADAPGGVLVTWETRSENRLLGFNVLRTGPASDESVRVNPVWVPAVGDEETPTSYQFLDPSADPDVEYRYRIEGITMEGLSSLSSPVSTPSPSTVH